jgi:hypothetical protein
VRHAARWSVVVGAAAMAVAALAGYGWSTPQRAAAPAAAPALFNVADIKSADVAKHLAEYIAAQRKFVSCMRSQGLKVPDPDAQGKVDYLPSLGGKFSTKGELLHKCIHLEPQIPLDVKISQLAPLTPEQIEDSFKFADCANKHGVPMPKPEANGYLLYHWAPSYAMLNHVALWGRLEDLFKMLNKSQGGSEAALQAHYKAIGDKYFKMRAACKPVVRNWSDSTLVAGGGYEDGYVLKNGQVCVLGTRDGACKTTVD